MTAASLSTQQGLSGCTQEDRAMGFVYVVLGAGRQGTAAAYDMVRWGDADEVILADHDLDVAERGARRIETMLGSNRVRPVQLDVTDLEAVAALLEPAHSCLSAVPYYHNLGLTRAAISSRTHLCDLGGNTGIARQQHALNEQAVAAGIAVVPNCGQVPGMGTSLLVYVIDMLDQALEAYLLDGGLPQHAHPPFRYLLTLNIEGLINEYAQPATFLRNGQPVEVAPLSGLQQVDFAPVGKLEAFVTGGGLDSMPWTYAGRLRRLENRTLRHPGHFAQLRAYYDLGLWDSRPVQVGAQQVVPRELFQVLFEPRVTDSHAPDMILLRARALGLWEGKPCLAEVELVDYQDPEGFSAMERCTGWSAAIVSEMAARGQLPSGCAGVETQVPAAAYVEELRRRGFLLNESRRDPRGSERLTCPRDDTPLDSMTFLGHCVQSCPRCFGILLSAGQLVHLHGRDQDLCSSDEGLEDCDPHWGECYCPGCRSHMQTRWFSLHRHVLVDLCLVCGLIWLDRDELKEVLNECSRTPGNQP